MPKDINMRTPWNRRWPLEFGPHVPPCRHYDEQSYCPNCELPVCCDTDCDQYGVDHNAIHCEGWQDNAPMSEQMARALSVLDRAGYNVMGTDN